MSTLQKKEHYYMKYQQTMQQALLSEVAGREKKVISEIQRQNKKHMKSREKAYGVVVQCVYLLLHQGVPNHDTFCSCYHHKTEYRRLKLLVAIHLLKAPHCFLEKHA